jgi:hypothetical protein
MTPTFDDGSEAFLSVLTLVIGADMVGNLSERDFLYDQVKGIELFGDPTLAEFSARLGQVTSKVYRSFPQQDGALTPEGIESLLIEVRSTLGPDLSKTLLQTAENLCAADGIREPEEALLGQIRQVLA